MIEIVELDGGCQFSVQAKPHSGRNGIQGVHAGCLRVAVTAAPERGKANEAVIELLSTEFDVPKSRIAIVRGRTHTRKLVRVEGLGRERLRRVLESMSARWKKDQG